MDYWRCAPFSLDWLRTTRDELLAGFYSTEVQVIQLVFLGAYILLFVIRTPSPQGGRTNRSSGSHGAGLRNLLLLGFGAAVLLAFVRRGGIASVVLFWGLCFGKGVLFLKHLVRDPARQCQFQKEVLVCLVVVLIIGAAVHPDWWQEFQYRGARRWQGIWRNPNAYGLLMAVGLVLALGLMRQTPRRKPSASRATVAFLGLVRLLTVAGCSVLGTGLLNSYSRGAWLGAALGIGYLAHAQAKLAPLTEFARRKASRAWHLYWKPCACLAASMMLLLFWICRTTEVRVIRRAFSVANVNDFSWRNRLLAYEGALQMIAAKPWIGLGWDRPTVVFDTYYKPVQLVDPLAIELNDYFTIGMALGLPALACFLGYLGTGIALRPGVLESRRDEVGPATFPARVGNTCELSEAWMAQVCRGALVVLLLGFWLERGLFRISFTVPFWILLELAADAESRCGTAIPREDKGPEQDQELMSLGKGSG
jgi:O-antigen ligase